MQEAAAAGAGVRGQRRLHQAPLLLQQLPQQTSRSPLHLGQVPHPLCPAAWAAWAGRACPGPAPKLGLRQLLLGLQLSLQAPLSQSNGSSHPP